MPADRDPAATASARFQRAAGRRAGLASFGQWWISELAPLIPRTTRAAVKRRRLRPVIAFEGDVATLWTPVTRGAELVMEPGARIEFAGDAGVAAGRAALASLGGNTRVGSGAAKVVVALPGRHTLRRTLTLPAALEENLKQALAYDLDRHTPFKVDELYFDAAIVGRDAARGEIRVDLAAARRGVVDRALQAVSDWGGNVVAVVPDLPAAAGAARLNLLPEDRRPANATWRRWQVLAPLALLAAVVLVSLALPIWQKREYAIALLRQVDAARAQAGVSEGLRNELERLTAEYNFALERKYAFPPTVQVLDEVTKLLPDDTWLTQMELKSASKGKDMQRELMLRGESVNAGRLITLFEESKVFMQAGPRSPTTKIQPGPGEIFDLVAQLRPLPPPPPVVLAGGSTGASPVDAAVPRESPSPSAAPQPGPVPATKAVPPPAAPPVPATDKPAPALPLPEKAPAGAAADKASPAPPVAVPPAPPAAAQSRPGRQP